MPKLKLPVEEFQIERKGLLEGFYVEVCDEQIVSVKVWVELIQDYVDVLHRLDEDDVATIWNEVRQEREDDTDSYEADRWRE